MRRWRRLACVRCSWLVAPLAGRSRRLPSPVDTFDAAWKIVRDTHFDPKMNGVDWNAVRTELRPRALAAATPGELRAVIRDMLGRLGQSHFALLPSSADSPREAPVDAGGDPGFEVRLSGRDLLVTSSRSRRAAARRPACKAGWRCCEPMDGTAMATASSSIDPSLPPAAAERRGVARGREPASRSGRFDGPSGASTTGSGSRPRCR